MNKLTRYTEDELIQAWREAHGLAPLGSVAACEGEDHLEALLRQRLRLWYASLLHTAPVERLPVRDLRDKVTQGESLPDGSLMLRLPSEGCRLVEVMLPEWDCPVRTFHAIGSPAHLRQRDSWLRSTPHSPVVVLDGDTILIYGTSPLASASADEREKVAANPGARLQRLLMTAPPADGSYQFADSDFPQIEIEL